MFAIRLSLLISLLVCLNVAVRGQVASPPDPTLESPYNTMLVHLYYLQAENYQPDLAARAFDLPEDSLMARKLAVQLKQILDGKGLFVRLNMLPQEPDYTDTLSRKPYYTPFPNELPDVYLERTEGKWHYSDQTAQAIPALHRKLYPFGSDFLLNLFPESSRKKFLGLATWQWIGLCSLILLAWLSHLFMSRFFRPVVRLLARSRYSIPFEDKSMLWQVARLASFVVLFYLMKAALPMLQLPIRIMLWSRNILEIVIVVLFSWLMLSIIDVVMQYAMRLAYSTEQKLDEQLIPILKRMLKVMVVLGGVIYVLQLLDVNVTALIAGVSIGGLAIALAAQDTVKNLIGSAMIFFDKPFQIGDWVVVNGAEGEIAEVGFRSTRVKTVDSSIISVPNDQIASAAITNMGIREFRLFKATIGVTYDTPPVLLEKFIEGLRKLIESNPDTKKDNYLVYFHSFGDTSLNIYFRTHVLVSTFKDELAVRERIAFGILTLAEALGIRFAFPTQTLLVEEFPGRTSLTPSYEKDPEKLDRRLQEYFAANKPPQDQMSTPPGN